MSARRILKAIADWVVLNAVELGTVAAFVAFIALVVYVLVLQQFKTRVEQDTQWCAGRERVLVVMPDERRECLRLVREKGEVTWER